MARGCRIGAIVFDVLCGSNFGFNLSECSVGSFTFPVGQSESCCGFEEFVHGVWAQDFGYGFPLSFGHWFEWGTVSRSVVFDGSWRSDVHYGSGIVDKCCIEPVGSCDCGHLLKAIDGNPKSVRISFRFALDGRQRTERRGCVTADVSRFSAILG